MPVHSVVKFFLIIVQGILLFGCVASPPRLAIPQDEPSMHHFKEVRPRVILVLGSGSSRGFAHAGVLKVLEEQGIPIDMIVGTSAGSIVGVLYADKPSALALKKLLLKTSRSEVIDYSLMNINQGLVSGNQLQSFLVKNLRAKSFEKLRIPFVAVATDLDTGKAHVFGSGPIAPAINASSAAPLFFRPVKLYGKTYIDGGLVDPVAVDVAKQFHPKIIIAVNLNYSLSKTVSTTSTSVFLRSLDMMLLQLNDYSALQAHVIIRPKSEGLSMFDGSQRAKLMHAGEAATYKVLPKIKKLLAKNHIELTR